MTNLVDKYMSSASFVRSPDEGGAPAPATGSGSTPPASSPPASPASTPSEPAGATSSGDDFSDFGGDDDLDSIDLGTPTAESQDPPEPAAAVAPAAPAPGAPAPAPAAPAAAAPTATPANESASSAPPQSLVESLTTAFDANAPALQEWLAQNAFALTKEEAEELETNAIGAVPKLLAKVATTSMKSTMNMIKNIVPQLIAQEVTKISGAQGKAKEALGEFYSANPHLNEKDHGALVTKWANAYRQANPKASRKEAIEYVGRAVSFESGIMPGSAPVQPKPSAFAPAAPGGVRPPATPPDPNASPFAGLGMELDE